MKRTPLQSYLADHLAGSVAALELLDHLRDDAAPPEEREFVTALRHDIAEDQQALRTLLRDLGGSESRFREAGAWITEKVAELKLRIDDPSDSGLRYFQALETLALGIRGKIALWTALEAVSDGVTELGAIDLPGLKQRALDQHAQVEERRINAAREALRAVTSSSTSPHRE